MVWRGSNYTVHTHVIGVNVYACVCLVSMVEIEVNALLKDIRAVFELNSGIVIFGSA